MDVKPIRTEKDYRSALAEVESLMDAEEGTPEADRLDVLATLVEAYEDKHWPIEPPDPVSAIKYTLEMRGLSRAALVPILGSRARVSEILNRKRHLTLPMIWRLVKELKIPAEILVAPYRLTTQARPKASAKQTVGSRAARANAARTRSVKRRGGKPD
jgi:HTH-type transcriptional regulator / antitoxin HigA